MLKQVLFAATLAATTCSLLPAQMPMEHGSMPMKSDGKPQPSPREMANVSLGATKIDISYGAPSLRGRKMVGEHDPYGKVWRVGANEATSFKTSGDVVVGKTMVPAGSYTLFVLPTADKWTLIISRKTGEWGIPYPGEGDDFARVDMMKGTMAAPQERMSITFEKTTATKTELHVKWDRDNYFVPIMKK